MHLKTTSVRVNGGVSTPLDRPPFALEKKEETVLLQALPMWTNSHKILINGIEHQVLSSESVPGQFVVGREGTGYGTFDAEEVKHLPRSSSAYKMALFEARYQAAMKYAIAMGINNHDYPITEDESDLMCLFPQIYRREISAIYAFPRENPCSDTEYLFVPVKAEDTLLTHAYSVLGRFSHADTYPRIEAREWLMYQYGLILDQYTPSETFYLEGKPFLPLNMRQVGQAQAKCPGCGQYISYNKFSHFIDSAKSLYQSWVAGSHYDCQITDSH